MTMHPEHIERWAKVREGGRRRYVWRHGVLGWGLSTGVVWALVMAAQQGWDTLPLFLAFGVVGFPVGGYFYGALTWKWFGKRYEAAPREQAAG